MSVYTVHEPPQRGGHALSHTERFAFVRDGFSWAAFLFGPLWMLRHRLWLALLAYILVCIGLVAAGRAAGISGGTAFFVGFLLALLIGFEAPSLRRYGLARRRWRNLGVVIGDDVESAERRFFDAWIAAEPVHHTPPSPAPPSANPVPDVSSTGIIGLFPEPGARA